MRAEAVPINDAARLFADELKTEPLAMALHGGEEYELLFTARPEHHARIAELSSEFTVRITAIGEIIAGSGVLLERNGTLEALPPSGYEHEV